MVNLSWNMDSCQNLNEVVSLLEFKTRAKRQDDNKVVCKTDLNTPWSLTQGGEVSWL